MGRSGVVATSVVCQGHQSHLRSLVDERQQPASHTSRAGQRVVRWRMCSTMQRAVDVGGRGSSVMSQQMEEAIDRCHGADVLA